MEKVQKQRWNGKLKIMGWIFPLLLHSDGCGSCSNNGSPGEMRCRRKKLRGCGPVF